jgi:hypothetical protein
MPDNTIHHSLFYQQVNLSPPVKKKKTKLKEPLL